MPNCMTKSYMSIHPRASNFSVILIKTIRTIERNVNIFIYKNDINTPMTSPKTKCVTRFLSDMPTSEDKFAHNSIAESIISTIQDEQGGKCIGVIGSWGSGKSSILRIVSNNIPKTTKMFVFDAWAHQGDPLRRSILEELIDHLINSGWINKEKWEQDKLLLSGKLTTSFSITLSKLSILGRLLAITLLLQPVGLFLYSQAYINPDNNKLLYLICGITLLCSPFVVYITHGIYLLFAKKEENSEGKISINHPRAETKLLSYSYPEPTSIEFQRTFLEIIKQALCESDRRIIFAIDNLDRLNSNEALSVLSTLRTFIDLNINHRCDELNRLWVVIPFDKSAIAKLWADKSDSSGTKSDFSLLGAYSDETAQAFLDKTFQIVFHVPEPVLTDWKDYLIESLKYSFPTHNTDDFHLIYRIFDSKLLLDSKSGAPNSLPSPTPRKIKLFVNRICSIHKYWNNEIPLSIQALYVASVDNRPAMQSALYSSSNLGYITEDQLPSDWQKYLAAIHFNVSLENALQVLLFDPIRFSIMNNNHDKYKELSDVNGFSNVLEQVVDSDSPNWISQNTKGLTNLAILMDSNVTTKGHESINRIWVRLISNTKKIQEYKPFDKEAAKGLQVLLSKQNSKELGQKILNAVTASFNTIASQSAINHDNQLMWLEGVNCLFEINNYLPDDMIRGNFHLKCSVKTYIDTLKKGKQLGNINARLHLIGCLADISTFHEEMNACIRENRVDSDVLDIFHRNISKLDDKWDTLLHTLTSEMQVNQLKSDRIQSLTEIALIALKTPNTDVKIITQIIESGYLLDHLYHAVTSKSQNAAARSFVFWLIYRPNRYYSSALSPHWLEGRQIYERILAAPMSYPEIINTSKMLIEKYKYQINISDRYKDVQEYEKAIEALIN